ncbi:MAG: PepSY domain-containing protein [Sinobacteraceae bacterium]|nr:PepSY domain-containing protein [Nevskiaceae bacterium]
MKEIETEKVKAEVRVIWGDYFKAPQIEKYPEIHDLTHKIMQAGSACKQHVHRADAGANAQRRSPANTPPKFLGLTEIENRIAARRIRIKEIDIRDKALEIEGYDSQNRKLELIVDRRSGEVLSRKLYR